MDYRAGLLLGLLLGCSHLQAMPEVLSIDTAPWAAELLESAAVLPISSINQRRKRPTKVNHAQLTQQLRSSLFQPPEPKITPVQQRSLARLAQFSGGVNQAHFNPDNGTPTALRFLLPAANKTNISKKDNAETVARRFLGEFRELLKLHQPEQELLLLRSSTDALGNRHLHFQQLHHGVPVWGKQLVVHLDALDRVFYFNGRYQPSFVTAPRRVQLSEQEVKERVLADLGIAKAWQIKLEQVIYGDTPPRLTYRVDVHPTLGSRWLYFVAASSGEILHRLNN
ncbi:MAG: hypothetical protein Q9N68_01720, partial [Gammaproteobacteria bacterium]|nr:hypothetical protein [Gammaproteobacteria bacterium]